MMIKLVIFSLLTVLGLVTSWIPWGTEEGFHGKGMPIFSVAWDRNKETGVWQDYPNLYALLLNPLFL